MNMLTKEQVQTIMQANPTATTFKVPEGVTSIGYGAFSGCSGLTSIVLPKGLKSIGAQAFECCSVLESIELPEGLESIGEGAFFGCSGLKEIKIPEGVTSIGDHTFFGCSGLTSIELPRDLKSIGDNAFDGCSGLTSIELPKGLVGIGEGAFERCRGLKSIVIPEGVTSIGEGAFYDCRSLKSIELPRELKSIGVAACRGCSGLISIEIPEGVTGIGGRAFQSCSSLEAIIAPAHLHEQLTREYPEKKVMTLQQAIEEGRLDDRLAGKIQKHIQRGLNEQDKQKLAERVQTLSLASKASLMALKIPKDKTFNDMSKTGLVQCFGDAPASLLQLLGIDAKLLAIKGDSDVGGLVVSHLTVRDKLSLDATTKGKLQAAMPGMPKERTSRVIVLGQNLESSNDTPDLSDRKPEEQRVDEKPSSSTSRAR
ncbi:MAG: leucine-rich repeat domain-containing protein [Pseudomonadota bacterium]|nr:leucine-rich repeat domain-containing protein [Pseudomonadota bacterium]